MITHPLTQKIRDRVVRHKRFTRLNVAWPHILRNLLFLINPPSLNQDPLTIALSLYLRRTFQMDVFSKYSYIATHSSAAVTFLNTRLRASGWVVIVRPNLASLVQT